MQLSGGSGGRVKALGVCNCVLVLSKQMDICNCVVVMVVIAVVLAIQSKLGVKLKERGALSEQVETCCDPLLLYYFHSFRCRIPNSYFFLYRYLD